MSRLPSPTGRLLLVTVSLFVLGGLAAAPAQSKRVRGRTTRTAVRRTARQDEQRSFTFGDITFSNFDTLSGDFSTKAEASGPNTTVVALDPKTRGRTQLQAEKFVAYMSEKSGKVERAEAIGNVRYSSTRPTADGKATETARGTGARGTYYRQQNRLVLQGPVRFFAEQPTADGSARQSVSGSSSQATYDGDKQVLAFIGNVDLTLTIPGTLEEPAQGKQLDEVTVNLGVRPLQYNIRNRGGSIQFRPAETEKKPAK